MLLEHAFDALLALDEALGRIKDLSLDHQRGLPTLHPLVFSRELGGLRPHARYVLERVLQVIDDLLLVSLLFSFDLLDVVSDLGFGVGALLKLLRDQLLFLFQLFFSAEQLLHAGQLIVIFYFKLHVLLLLLHLQYHSEGEAPRNVRADIRDSNPGYALANAH